jgi:hypothetical protein
MHLRARSAGKDLLDILNGLVEETVASFNSVCELFANDEKALRYFQTYCYGYMLVFLPSLSFTVLTGCCQTLPYLFGEVSFEGDSPR